MNKFRDPINIHCQSILQTEIHTTTFTLNTNDGRYLYGEFEGLYQLTPFLYVNGWARGSWMKFTGEGESDLSVLGSTVIFDTTFAATPRQGPLPVDHSTLENWWYAVGVSLDFQF
jgi:hypothetical protein